MAVTKILAKNMRINDLVRYICNPDKTEEKTLVTCLNCNEETAAREMAETKEWYGKTGGVQAYHIIQSFKPGEITPELAHEVGLRFADAFLPGYEVVVGTHVDRDHIHNHLCFNSVCKQTGKKYTNTFTDYYKGIRKISDNLCREHGLSVVMETGNRGLSYAEWKMHEAGFMTYRDMLDQDVEQVLSMSTSLGDFYELMEDRGYTIQHHSRYPSFNPYGAEKPFRAKRNGKSLTEDDLRELIDEEMAKPEIHILRRKQFVPYPHWGKLHGFRALYVSWMYVLGFVGQGGRIPNVKTDYVELRKLDQYKRQQEFLEENKIDTYDQLDQKETELERRIQDLTKTRIILNSNKKRKRRQYQALSDLEYYAEAANLYLQGQTGMEEEYRKYLDAADTLKGTDIGTLKQEKAHIYSEVAEINVEIRKCRSDIRTCQTIRNSLPDIEEQIREINQEEIQNDFSQQQEEEFQLLFE